MEKIGFALSGGGVRGFFHSGLMYALKEQEFPIHIMSGTSAGAIAASLHSAGIDQKEVTDRFPKRIRSLFYEPSLLIKTKFNPTSILRRYIEEFLSDIQMEDLPIPVLINAVNIATGDTEVFSQGSLLEAVMAACAIPGVFNVFHSNGKIYVDGGLTLNLPAASIRASCDILIGVNLLPFKKRTYTKLPGRRHLIQRSVDIYHRHNNKRQEELCDYIISPYDLTNYPTYNTTNKNKLFQLGYDTGINLSLDEVIQSIKSRK